MKVVIVDDEAMVREWFASSIEKMAPDYQLVGTAHDGLSGLKLCREAKADIAVVDIKMPGMDGIELIRQLHEHCPRTSSIVLSSYSDFDYARKAMKAGAADYLLKAEVTHDTLREALDHIAPSPASRAVDSPAARDKNNPEDSESLGSLLSRDGFPSERTIAYALLADEAGEDRAIPETFARLCESLGCGGLCEYSGKTVYLAILHLKESVKRDPGDLGPVFANRLIRQLHSSGRKILVGIVGNTSNGSDYRDKLVGACKAVLCARCRSEEIGIQSFAHGGPEILYKRFLRKLEAGERISARQIMDEILASARDNPEGAVPLLLDLSLESVGQITPAVLGDAVHEAAGIINRGALVESLAESLGNHLSSRNRELLFSHPVALAQTEPIARALDFLSRNFHKDLGLDEVAGLVDLSPGYLSELFHKETGDYFQDHLTKLRVSKAAELLSRTQVPVRRIGELIGYPNPSYFGQVFKKQYGESPGTYRKNNFQGKIQ